MRVTNEMLAVAHAECQVRDERFRKAMAADRWASYERWRVRFREAESIRYVRRFRAMWDGDVCA